MAYFGSARNSVICLDVTIKYSSKQVGNSWRKAWLFCRKQITFESQQEGVFCRVRTRVVSAQVSAHMHCRMVKKVLLPEQKSWALKESVQAQKKSFSGFVRFQAQRSWEDQNKLGSGQLELLSRNVLERKLLGVREAYVAKPIWVKPSFQQKKKTVPCVKTWVSTRPQISPQNISCSWARNLSEGKRSVRGLNMLESKVFPSSFLFLIEKEKPGLSLFLPP